MADAWIVTVEMPGWSPEAVDRLADFVEDSFPDAVVSLDVGVRSAVRPERRRAVDGSEPDQ